MTVTAIVVARAGSTRLPRKALLPFAGTTLIGHKVRQLMACEQVDRVVVGSDGDEILAEAAKHGATCVKRDDYHCDETRCSANDMLRDMAGKVDGDVILWAHPTNPLVKPATYDAAVWALLNSPEHDSLLSVTRIQRHAWRDGKPFNYDPWGGEHPVAAELEPVFVQDGAIFIQPRRQMLGNAYFFGAKPLLFEVDPIEGTDIDTETDYRVARALSQMVV